MRQLFLVSLVMGLIVAAAAFVVVHDVPDSVEANTAPPRMTTTITMMMTKGTTTTE